MYQIKDGILHRDGERVFALGQSYYPSFHPSKFPVPPEGDRMGEMKKDLKMMAEMGFNHVRFAALGSIALQEDGTVSVDTPFIDAMIREAEKNGISVSVRQQGYSVNLRGFKNVEMLDWNGVKQGTAWFDFIRTTLCHPGILEDNRTYARAMAEHFSVYDNMVAFQIYNEPHFPGPAMFDYHPESIRAFRQWLVEKQVLTEQEAATYEPPRSRKEQSPRMWALWRLFARDSMTAFLNNASDASKQAVPLPTYTCFTSCQISQRNAYRGCDYFANAQAMDIVGYTTYLHAIGEEYYALCLQASTAQCAAELEGGQAWCLELDSRTYIPCSVYNRTTYAVLGSGCKGIVYYQWRGDCPVPGVPHPNSCGLLNYDGTKTPNFDNAARVNDFISQNNGLLMELRRVHEGVGMLHSDYAAFLCDGMENGDKAPMTLDTKNSYMVEYTRLYRQLHTAGFSVSITDAGHLDDNPFGIRVLFIPRCSLLAPEEQAAVDRFRKKGGIVYENGCTHHNTGGIGLKLVRDEALSYEQRQFDHRLTVEDAMDLAGFSPKAVSLEPRLGVQCLEGRDCTVLVLTNISAARDRLCARLRVNIPFRHAELLTVNGPLPVTVADGCVTVDGLTDGALLVLR